MLVLFLRCSAFDELFHVSTSAVSLVPLEALAPGVVREGILKSFGTLMSAMCAGSGGAVNFLLAAYWSPERCKIMHTFQLRENVRFFPALLPPTLTTYDAVALFNSTGNGPKNSSHLAVRPLLLSEKLIPLSAPPTPPEIHGPKNSSHLELRPLLLIQFRSRFSLTDQPAL